MAIFEYVGKSQSGKEKSGRVTADHRRQALLLMKEKGISVFQITERAETVWTKDISASRRVKMREKVMFLRQFATIISAGITVVEALQILSEQINNKYFKSVIRSMAEELEVGHTLSESFELYPKIFNPIIINMIRAGESGGRLEESLEHLAVYFERQNQTKQKLLTAISYPLFISVAAVGVILFLLTSVIPMFQSMFAAYGTQIPAITKGILSLSDFLRSYGLLLFLLFGSFILVILGISRIQTSKIYLHSAILKVPILGQLIYKTDLARVLWMLSLLFGSSVPILEALTLAENVSGNEAIKQALRRSKASLKGGQTLSESFKTEKVFPSIIHHMTAIGEKTGALETMLDNVASYYEEEVNHMLDRVKALIEPVLMVVLSIVVGLVVMAIVIPMFQIYQQI